MRWVPWERVSRLLDRWCEMHGKRLEYHWIVGHGRYAVIVVRERRP